MLGIDYFLFRTDWWGAPQLDAFVDANGQPSRSSAGYLPGEKQIVHLFNMGATFYW